MLQDGTPPSESNNIVISWSGQRLRNQMLITLTVDLNQTSQFAPVELGPYDRLLPTASRDLKCSDIVRKSFCV